MTAIPVGTADTPPHILNPVVPAILAATRGETDAEISTRFFPDPTGL